MVSSFTRHELSSFICCLFTDAHPLFTVEPFHKSALFVCIVIMTSTLFVAVAVLAAGLCYCYISDRAASSGIYEPAIPQSIEQSTPQTRHQPIYRRTTRLTYHPRVYNDREARWSDFRTLLSTNVDASKVTSALGTSSMSQTSRYTVDRSKSRIAETELVEADESTSPRPLKVSGLYLVYGCRLAGLKMEYVSQYLDCHHYIIQNMSKFVQFVFSFMFTR